MAEDEKVTEILKAFCKLKDDWAVRNYDDELFLKDLPENEPISLVIPFERSAKGYSANLAM